jgi:hypothetical protein
MVSRSEKTMSLPEQYRKLLNEYDRVLDLSERILDELKKRGKENDISFLLEKKEVTGKSIARLTKEIASAEIENYSGSNLKTLAMVKGLLLQITEKARLLQEIEEKIQNLLQQKDLR